MNALRRTLTLDSRLVFTTKGRLQFHESLLRRWMHSPLPPTNSSKSLIFSKNTFGHKTPSLFTTSHSFRRWATSTTPTSTPVDPAETEALRCLQAGTQKLEEGDVEGAKQMYKRSVEIKRDAGSLFNLGVTHYHLKEFDEAIEAWKESIALQPSSPDAHTNLASAYIISSHPRPDLALHHLNIASSLSPEDPEIAFNLAAVLEACGHLEDALTHYKRSKKYGVDRAELHIRNVSAKILGKRMKDAEEKSNPK